jgi:hypothetical protein
MSSAGAAPRAVVLVSNARAEASRKNGARSRGPKTSEGKARSAQNALKHGMRAAKHVVLPDEDAAEFAALEAALRAELAPVGVLQTVLARRVAAAAWRLARADRIEADLFKERWLADGGPGIALIRDGNGTRSFETLLRYRGAAMAEFMRALRTLKALQAEQAQPVEHAAAAALALAAPASRPAARARPDEPERLMAYVLPDLPAAGRLHEQAAPWTPPAAPSLPNEPETGRARSASTPVPRGLVPNEPDSRSNPPESELVTVQRNPGRRMPAK